MKYDKTSYLIISKLIKDGRVTHKALSEELNFSRPAIHQRVEKLEKENVINGYSANVDFEKIGFSIDAFMLINIHTMDYNEAIHQVMSLSKRGIYIENVYRITGDKCILIRIKTSSPDRLRELHDSILKVEGLVDTNTMLILQEEHNEFDINYIENNLDY